jgi:formate dehydrogenase alpha subunit
MSQLGEHAKLQPITITLEGREVSGYRGMTILELARESGVYIPTLCHHSHLSPTGACRVCLVENEQNGSLLASCITPIVSGMVINANSPRVIEHRKTIIKLILASHPDSCMVCDKGNRCELRQISSDMGIGISGFQKIPQPATIEEVNPFIERDLSKCILCAKCIRTCQELVVEGAIDYFRRGFVAKPATLNDLPLDTSECTFCGTCVASCPTGALMEKERIYGTTTTATETTCPFCGCGCSICLEVKDNQVVHVTPGKKESVNHGALCAKGSYGCDFVHSLDRLKKPLVKRNKIFEEVSWEEALEQVASGLMRIKEEQGPDSLAVLGSSKCTNEDNYVLQRFARCVLGTNNIDNGSRIYNSATRTGLGSSIGFPGTTNYLDALEQSELIIVIGADPVSSAPIVGYAIKRAVKYKNAKLVLVDPRKTKLSSFAHLWLRPHVSTDIALLNSLAKVIIDEGLLDEEYVSRRTDNFGPLTKALAQYYPEYAETITGIPSEEIRAVARLYAKATQPAIIYGTGISQQRDGTDSIKAIANLAILTGHIEHGGIYALQRENNGQGACDMGALPDFLSGYQNVKDTKTRKKFEERWKVDLPAKPGLSAMEIIQGAKRGKIRGLYIVGENPCVSFAHSELVAEALTSLDFLVVQDMFLTDTAKLANVVLPAASFAEKEGTFTNFEGKVNRVGKAIVPIGETLPDWKIILRLADKMGYPLPFSSLEHVMNEIEELVPGYEDYIESERQDDSDKREARHTYGKQLLKGFARFYPVEYTPCREDLKPDYPFTLLTGTTLYHLGTGNRTSRAWRLKKFSPRSFIEIGKADAQKLGITHGDKVSVISPISKLTTSATVTDGLPEGTLFMPISFPDTPVNGLFGITLDPQSKSPSLKACKVKLERAGNND